MARLFNEHKKQRVYSLDGTWKFHIDPEDKGEAEGWQNGIPNGESVSVPSVWNTDLSLLTYEGCGWYEKTFYCPDEGVMRLTFEAVMTQADIWFDGVRMEGHYGGFCQFERLVYAEAGEHRLTVRADNRFDEHSIPQAKVDWFHYGGITRSVSYEMLSGICVLGEHFVYELSNNLQTAEGTFELTLYNAEQQECSSRLTVALGDQVVFEEAVTLACGEERLLVTPRFTITDVHLWDTCDPYLYTVRIESDTYDLYDRVGFRKIEVKDGQILLNSRAIELRGVNRHEEHPDFGFAFPASLMKRDIDIITEMGANAIRGSHYPNSRCFVDMLDERGILFWSEIPIWGCGFSEETLGDALVIERTMAMHTEMVKYYYNHPSIVIFGMHNEIPSGTQNAYGLSRLCYGLLKEKGGNRLVVYASHTPHVDICFEFCDVICLNLYHGWYGGNIEAWQGAMDKFRARRSELGFDQKPVIISEFGAAAIYGNHTFDCVKWSEEYQAKLIGHCLDVFHSDPMVAGCFIWQYCDIRTSEEMGLGRARSFNNKGLLSEYRKPKAAYFTVAEKFKAFAKEE
ncbi:MAG: beta-glucuronidase [Clostridia bacterium]|nr:beta-glucuronidase [Clostridia bacterium]